MLAGTQDSIATFAEHEELKTILRAGRAHFEIRAVCKVPTRRAPCPQFPVFTACMGSRDPTAPRHPVLVLSSAKDRLVNPLCSAQLASSWNAPQHQHETAGHDLPNDDGAWVCQQVAMWQHSIEQSKCY